MAKVLRSYGIHDKLVNTINGSYSNTRSKVYSPYGVSEEFDIVAGVLQGELYHLTIYYCTRLCTKKSNQLT